MKRKKIKVKKKSKKKMNEFLVLLARELLCDIPWTKKKLVSMLEILFF